MENIVNEYQRGKKVNQKLKEDSRSTELFNIKPTRSDYIEYNMEYLLPRAEVLYRSMLERFNIVKFKDLPDFKMWLIEEQTTFRGIYNGARDDRYILTSLVRGETKVASRDTLIFLPTFVANIIESLYKYSNEAGFKGLIEKTDTVVSVYLTIYGYNLNNRYILYNENKKNSDAGTVVHFICREYYMSKVADALYSYDVCSGYIRNKLKKLSKAQPRIISFNQKDYDMAERIIDENNFYNIIDEEFDKCTLPIIQKLSKNIIPVKIDDRISERYKRYLREHVSEEKIRYRYHSMMNKVESNEKHNRTYDNFVSSWSNADDFIDWFFNKQNSFLFYHKEKGADATGYLLDKDLFYNGTFSPNSCVFLPHILDHAIMSKPLTKKNELPLGVRYKDQNYRVVLGMLGSPGGVGIRILSIPKKNIIDPISVGFLVFKLSKEYYLRLLTKEFYKRGLIGKTIRDALMNYEVIEPDYPIVYDGENIRDAWKLMRSPARPMTIEINGKLHQLEFKNIFSKIKYYFKKFSIPEIDNFESKVEKFM